jgi:two-component system response regulator DevR
MDAVVAVRILVVDDHEVVRRGLREILQQEPDLTVCGEAGTAAEALALAAETTPDVVLLDVRLPDGDGVAVCRELRRRPARPACLILTSYPDDEVLVAAVLAGAAGFLLKEVRGLDLVSAVRTVAAGGSMLTPEATSLVLERLRDAGTADDPARSLTVQERRVFQLIGAGLSNRQIAQEMDLAEKTVKNHVSSLLRKLHLQRRTQAAVLAERSRHGSDGGPLARAG